MLTSDECARRYRTLESQRRTMGSNMAPWDAVAPVEAEMRDLFRLRAIAFSAENNGAMLAVSIDEMRELLFAFDNQQAPPARLRNAYDQMAPYMGHAPKLL